jgi:microsomal dipeptidase-like Zn-dependent dipeptidase
VIGIGLFRYATCGKTIADTVRAMRYAADLVGVGHVALGSDWDGSAAAIDASGLPLLTEGLLKAGFTREDIAAIMGGNVLRFLRETLH